MLEGTRFDIVLTDIIMPGREGIETIIEIRKRWPDTKIVAMSGGGRIEPSTFLDLAKSFGADVILKKPFKQSALLEALASLSSSPPLLPRPELLRVRPAAHARLSGPASWQPEVMRIRDVQIWSNHRAGLIEWGERR